MNGKRAEHTGPWNYKDNTFNAEAYQPLILLNYRLPEDFKERTGTFFADAGKNRTMFFEGIYQVVKIESRIDKGSFTQVLHCVRLNNQQGKGTDVKLGSDFSKIIEGKPEKKKKIYEYSDGISDGTYS